MSFSAVVIGLCALVALSHGGCLEDIAMNKTIRYMHQDISATLTYINGLEGQLGNLSCASEDMTELERFQQNFTAANLAQFSCHMMAVSRERTPDLRPRLENISQYIQSVAEKLNGQAVEQKCTEPTFVSDVERYIYIKCLLERLVKLLNKAKC